MDKFLNKHHSKFSRLMDLIYFLVVTNIFAILGTIVGLFVFGLFPSIMTTYTLVKMRIRGESFSIGSTFIEVYKREFKKANLVGFVLMVVWVIISLCWFFYLDELSSSFHWIGLAVIGLFGIVLFVLTMILPITYVYFPKFSKRSLFSFSAILALGMPLLSLIIVLNILFFYFIVLIRFISIFPFLAFTLPAYINMLVANKRIMKLFTVYTDEHVSLRTLNSYGFHEKLYQLMVSEYDENPLIDLNDFLYKIENGPIEGRLSLVMLDQEEEVKGFMLSSYKDFTIYIEFIWIDPKYQRRRYGSKMLSFIKKPLEQGSISTIELLGPKGYFQEIPKECQSSLIFFRKNGFKIVHEDFRQRFILTGEQK